MFFSSFSLLSLILLGLVIYLLIAFEGLRRRMTKAENALRALLLDAPATGVQPASRPAPEETEKPPATAAEAQTPWQRKTSADEEPPVAPPSAPVPAPDPQPKKLPEKQAYVFRADLFANALAWAQGNWFYLVAAASLGLAGVFLVQYGIENGYLSPALRVSFALILGLILIGFGEYLRRKGGDDPDELFAHLPSTFAAGGLVSMFAGVLSARVLYGLIGAETALAGLAITAAIAILIGWFYGPLLAAMGILGAVAAPFLVSGDAGSAGFLYYYFALIATAALGVDTFRRWAWLSAFGVILTAAGASLMFVSAGEPVHFMAFALILAAVTVIIPGRALVPRHDGSMVLEEFRPKWIKDHGPSGFPTRLAAGVFVFASLVALSLSDGSAGTFWLAFAGIAVLFLMTSLWAQEARALSDLTLLPVLALPLLVVQEVVNWGGAFDLWRQAISRAPETDAPNTILILLGTALAGSLILAYRAARSAPYPILWALGAAVLAPLMAILLEVFWQPADVIGTTNWAWHPLVVAAVMVLLAERFARWDGADRTRAALFTLAALTMISLALMLMLSEAALTLALAAMVLAAAALDRRFNMAYLGIFVIVGTGVAGWRLILDPGLFWSTSAPFWGFVAGHGGTLVLLAVTWMILKDRDRARTFAVVDAALWSLTATFFSVLIYRLIDIYAPNHVESHATTALLATVWLISSANQIHRLRVTERFRWVRYALASLYGMLGLMMIGLGLAFQNPLTSSVEDAFGPYILDSLLVAYALPGLVMLIAAVRFDHIARWLRYGIAGMGGGLVAYYVALEIRRIWRGDTLSVPGTTDPELYTYTVVMLIAATGLLFYAFWTHSNWLRKLALAGIGLTVAKVFLIDFSGLTGLTRVFSFLLLGLALAGLAWLDRWFGARGAPVQEPEEND